MGRAEEGQEKERVEEGQEKGKAEEGEAGRAEEGEAGVVVVGTGVRGVFVPWCSEDEL